MDAVVSVVRSRWMLTGVALLLFKVAADRLLSLHKAFQSIRYVHIRVHRSAAHDPPLLFAWSIDSIARVSNLSSIGNIQGVASFGLILSTLWPSSLHLYSPAQDRLDTMEGNYLTTLQYTKNSAALYSPLSGF
ncbi:hypothetical protein BV22DRAFT_432475 [Leucogyrophana mollusca]|uniref:Uncharacterized protein n=1 Tax=Leucogyrophana mollusca TaxID=85980 RepID=A0ACB8BJ05_9AGAM|nr:hypothetical protein BV22DRAFT_432475 [Leucogyrophana mollusca]